MSASFKNAIRFSILIFISLLWPFFASAQEDVVTPVAENVLSAVNVFVVITFVLAVAIFGWGIVRLILAAGDPTEIEKAKQFIWWGVIGMGIIAMIGGIINWIAAYLGINPFLGLDILVPRVIP